MRRFLFARCVIKAIFADMKRLFFLSVILVLLASCSSTERVSYSQSTLDSFVGQTHEELVQRLGAPTESVPDGGEGYILVYEGNKDIFRYSSKYASKSGTLPKAQLYMSKDGVCQRVRVDNTDSVKVTKVGGTIVLVLILAILFL